MTHNSCWSCHSPANESDGDSLYCGVRIVKYKGYKPSLDPEHSISDISSYCWDLLLKLGKRRHLYVPSANWGSVSNWSDFILPQSSEMFFFLQTLQLQLQNMALHLKFGVSTLQTKEKEAHMPSTAPCHIRFTGHQQALMNITQITAVWAAVLCRKLAWVNHDLELS